MHRYQGEFMRNTVGPLLSGRARGISGQGHEVSEDRPPAAAAQKEGSARSFFPSGIGDTGGWTPEALPLLLTGAPHFLDTTFQLPRAPAG